MPRVGGKKYPYTPAGMAAADYAKKKRKTKTTASKARGGIARGGRTRTTPKSRRGR